MVARLRLSLMVILQLSEIIGLTICRSATRQEFPKLNKGAAIEWGMVTRKSALLANPFFALKSREQSKLLHDYL